MCHGHPHQHTCSHTSIKWLYCPEAIFDLDTGYEEHCSNPIYSTIQPTNADCPLQHCYYKAVRGSWNCCKCGQGPNTLGWCTMPVQEAGQSDVTGETQLIGEQCNHGCCKRCTRHPSSSRGSTPDKTYAELRKHSSRKHGSSKSSSSSRGSRSSVSAYEYASSTCPTVPEEDGYGDPMPSPLSERHARRSSYQVDLDYASSKKSKTSSSSSSSHSGSKKRSHHHHRDSHHGHHSHHGHTSHHGHHKTRVSTHC